MIAEIITSGTELLLGDTIDTNSAYIARLLRDVGVNLYLKSSVGDNVDRMAQLVEQALDRSDVVIITGGLGPTVDDVTRDAVAQATGRPLELVAECLEHVESVFARWGRPLSANNRRQAFLPEGARPIHNPVGTAPGFILETGRGAVIALPGVPREMERLMHDAVLPYLIGRLGGEQVVIRSMLLRTVGVGESVIDEQIDALMRGVNPTVGLSAHLGSVDIRITARAANAAVADAMIAEVAAEVRRRVGERNIFGTDGDELAMATARALAAAEVTLAIVETATRGDLVALLRSTPKGAKLVSKAYRVESSAELADVLGLSDAQVSSFGWISQMSATAAAAAIVDTYDDGWGLVLLGDPGNHGDLYGPEAGVTFVALASSKHTRVEQFPYGGDGVLARRWVVSRVLNLLRLAALEVVATK